MSDTTTLDERMEEEPLGKTLTAYLLSKVDDEKKGVEHFTRPDQYKDYVKTCLEQHGFTEAEAALVYDHPGSRGHLLGGFMKGQPELFGDTYLLNNPIIERVASRLRTDLKEFNQNEVYIFCQDDDHSRLGKALSSAGFKVDY